MKKAIGYVRISTKDQSHFSITGQEKYIRDYASRKELEISEIFTDDGRSAKSFDRPDWKKLEEFIAKHHRDISYLIVAKYDRFSRNAAEGLQKIELIEKKYRIIIASVFEEMYIDYDSPFFFKQRADMLVNAEFELHVIRDRTKFGNHQARSSGRYISSAPFGYKNARDERNKPVIQIVVEKVSIIQKIYQLFLTGTSLKEIAKEVRDAGFNLHGHSAIRRILSNCIYAGIIFVPAYRNEPARYVKGIHEAIIDEHSWWEVQYILGNKVRSRSVANEEVALRGELRCHCGRNMTAGNSRSKTGRYYWYYKCLTHPKHNFSAIRLHAQFDAVLQNLSLSELNIQYIRSSAHEIMNSKLVQRGENLKRLRLQLHSAQNNLESLEEKYITGHIRQETFTKWESKYSSEISSYRYQISGLETGNTAKWQSFETNLPLLTNLKFIYHSATLRQKHTFLRLVFNHTLSYSGGLYRTRYIHPLFQHNALILKEKELLELELAGEKVSEFEESTQRGSIIELSHEFMQFVSEIKLNRKIA